VAYLTVLKVINQRNEPEAREVILQALFCSPNDKILEDILGDQACGATLIFKILTTPFFDDSMRAEVIQNVRNVLSRLKAAPSQGYKRLMDEVGLSSRSGTKSERDPMNQGGGSPYQERSRSISQHGSRSGPGQPSVERQNSGQFMSTLGQHPYGPQAPLDTNILSPFEQYNVSSPIYTPTTMGSHQIAYQQAMLQASSQNMTPNPVYGGYPPSSASFDTYRQNQHSPMGRQPLPMSTSPMIQSAGYPPPGFPPMMSGGMMNGYNGYPVPYYPQQQMQQQAGGRRGRVSGGSDTHRQ
jgi:protein JSN1